MCLSVISSQELKTYNKNTKAEVEQARVQERAPIISPFVPSPQAQQLPHLRLVRMIIYWIAKKRDVGSACVAEHVNPVLPPAVHGDMEPSFNRLMKTKLAFFNTFVSVLCGPGVAAVLPAGHAKLPTVSRDAVVFERAAAQVVRGGERLASRHPEDGMRNGPRPSKSKLLRCVRCEMEGSMCWGPPAAI